MPSTLQKPAAFSSRIISLVFEPEELLEDELEELDELEDEELDELEELEELDDVLPEELEEDDELELDELLLEEVLLPEPHTAPFTTGTSAVPPGLEP